MKFSIKDLVSKLNHICRKFRILLHVLKKPSQKTLIFVQCIGTQKVSSEKKWRYNQSIISKNKLSTGHAFYDPDQAGPTFLSGTFNRLSHKRTVKIFNHGKISVVAMFLHQLSNSTGINTLAWHVIRKQKHCIPWQLVYS